MCNNEQKTLLKHSSSACYEVHKNYNFCVTPLRGNRQNFYYSDNREVSDGTGLAGLGLN